MAIDFKRPTDEHQLNLKVSKRVYERVGEMAEQRGIPRTTVVRQLFEAAYTARVRPPSGDEWLDAMVAVTLLLHGSGHRRDTIAVALGTDPEVVARILEAWERFRVGS